METIVKRYKVTDGNGYEEIKESNDMDCLKDSILEEFSDGVWDEQTTINIWFEEIDKENNTIGDSLDIETMQFQIGPLGLIVDRR